ncbi:TetR/AcrR family transcriptional regulator [Sulfitobacter sp. 916]|uniref:TetR/AcrR family transcriptional regulator n=1 Tax=unclassified Sulfitobacter TaxID=196795 RepID=UPI0025D2DF5F|nr:TetR/AcrR family transcriptional regulator [Sulfitobacter sp.]
MIVQNHIISLERLVNTLAPLSKTMDRLPEQTLHKPLLRAQRTTMMPWEKSFEIDATLDKAAEVFSVKGYEATSVADLVKAMGVNRGSLYATFGNKHDLFKSVLTRFVEERQAQTLAQLEAKPDPIDAILSLFDTVVHQSVTEREQKGNLIIHAALEFPNHSEDVQAVVDRALSALEDFFLRVIEKGKKAQIIDASIDAGSAAKSLVALTVGYRVLARGAFDNDALRLVKDSSLRIIGA